MKKGLVITAVFFMLFAVAYFISEPCLKSDPISCPDAAEVVSAYASDSDGNEKKADEVFHKDLLFHIKRAIPTTKRSVNDTPYAQFYYTVTLNSADGMYRYYIYKDGSRYYIEKPYEGIYKSDKEAFDFMAGLSG